MNMNTYIIRLKAMAKFYLDASKNIPALLAISLGVEYLTVMTIIYLLSASLHPVLSMVVVLILPFIAAIFVDADAIDRELMK